jgi:DNA-binding NarL/FixJ family response regulator
MGLHELVGYAVRHESGSSSSPLTEREQEVTILLTKGLSNRELAARLMISEGTAKRHIENILSKLGLRSRTQLAAWAVQEGVGVACDVEDVPGQRS